jgi:hypothetical protein
MFLTCVQKKFRRPPIEIADAFVRFGGDLNAIEHCFKR